MAGNNGSAAAIPTIAQLRKDNRGGLRGSPFDPFASLRFFGAYGDGSIRDPKWDVRDIKAAFDSPHGAQLEKNFQTLALPIRSAPWEIKDAPGGKAEGDAARDMFGRLFGPLIDRSTNGLWSKKVYHEIEWDLTGREARIVDLHWRPTGSCSDRRDEHGRLNGFLQRLPFDEKRMRDDPRFPGQVWIEPLRAFVYINGRNRNPILGHSDLQITWALSETIRKLSLILFQFLELQAVPRVLAYGQNETDAGENADQLSQAVGGGVIPWAAPPDGSKPFDVLEASGTGANMFLETLRWLQSQQVSSILADFSTLADQAGSGRGSYALSNDQRAWFEANLQAKATELADQITEQVLRPAALLNFGSDAKVPSMSIGPVSAAEVDNALTMLNSTVTSPNAQVPPGVVDALWVKVSRKLGLDVDQVREAVESWRDEENAPEAGDEDAADSEGADEAFRLAHTIDLTYGLVTDALAGVDPRDALEQRLELARKVRTAAGAKRYGVPIGSPIPEGRKRLPKAPKVGAGKSAPGSAPSSERTRKIDGSGRPAVGRDTSESKSAPSASPDRAEQLRNGTLGGPDGIGKRQASAAKFAVVNGTSTYVEDDGTPAFDPPPGRGYTRFDADGTAWKSENGEEPERVSDADMAKLVDTYFGGDSDRPSTPATPKATAKKPRAATTTKPAAAKQQPAATPPAAGAAPPATPTADELGPVVPSSTLAPRLVRETKAVKFSKDERDAVYAYRTGLYGDMNDALRRGRYEDGYRVTADEIRAHNDAMASAIDKYTMPSSVTVTRGVSSSKWLPRGKDLTGSTIVNQGFVSTAMGSDADFFASGGTSPMLINITVPKGMHALPVDGVRGTTRGEASAENELVLPHGTRFKITKDATTTVNGKKVRSLSVTALPPAEGTTTAGKAKLA